jgi:thymidylate synthase
MNSIDTQYQILLQSILDYGVEKSDRTGTGTKSIFGYTIRHRMSDGFPLLTTKKMPWKTIVTELLWFLKGDTNIKYLLDNGCNIWTGDAYKSYREPRPNDRDAYTVEEFVEAIKTNPEFAAKYGELGPIYGAGWRRWKTQKNSIPVTRPMPNLREGLDRTYLGVANGKGKQDHFLGKTWEGMIARCYDPNSIEYPNYGACNVYVCDEWLEFERFKEDVKLLPNWDLKEQSPREYVLDKDGLGTGYCYSIENCQWVTHSENANLKSEKVYTVERDNVIYTFSNPTTFCKEQGISNKNFSDLWTGSKNAKKRNGFKLVSIELKSYNTIDQIANLINDLKTNPDSRRLMVNAWNVGELDQMVLPPCHYGFQCYVRDGKYLSLMWNQRSVDTFLGLPFNIASYALLLTILAKEVNMVPDELIGNLGDTHLYLNHIEQAKEQIKRDFYELPTLKHLKEDSFYKSLSEDQSLYSHLDNTDFELVNYQSHPAIKAPLSN